MSTILAILGGLTLLILGGDLLVRGAVGLAQRLGMSPLLIGLTLVGFGTSTPELVTSVEAAMIGSPGIAVGNIVGSNIANILLILGLSALIFPIPVGSLALKRDSVVVVVAALMLAVAGFVMPLGQLLGVAFLTLLAAYIFYAWRHERERGSDHTAAFDKGEAAMEVRGNTRPQSIGLGLLMAVAGLVLVVLGGNYLVRGSIALAKGYGISETVIGLTIVAVGTSMPEFVTSVIAAARRQSDVALGNVLGSNIYNILGIGGVTALIAPTNIPAEIARFDAPVMLGVSVLLLVMMWSARRIGRREGLVLVLGYCAYIWAIWPPSTS